MGVGEIEKEGAPRGQRGVSGKLRVLGFETAEGTGCAPLLLSGIQMHSSRTPGLPFTSSAISPSVCDTDTVTAPPSAHNTE